jgi:phosphatidylserine decarboxylase
VKARDSALNPSRAGGYLFVWLQHLLPQHALSRLVLKATRVRARWFKNLLVRVFLKLYAVNMNEAAEPDPYRYGSFNEFFTRTLRPGARRVAAAASAIASPVDGTVSECGQIEGGQLLQAKGRLYSLSDLLAGADWAGIFDGGAFATLYLAPFDYHRIHMPLRGTLAETRFVPGRLFSVNAATTRHVPRLFARNERVVTLFQGEAGRFALVLVGALNVGSIRTVWAGDITPSAARVPTTLPHTALTLEKGEELGRFNMGSTVIVMFERGRARWLPALGAGTPVQLGQTIGALS